MKSSWNETPLTILLSILIVLFGSTSGSADDVGITKARLIQQSENRYTLEADVTQALVWAIKAPIFPDRFQVSELEYINQAGWIVVQATATTTGEPLSGEHSGTSLAARDLDDDGFGELVVGTPDATLSGAGAGNGLGAVIADQPSPRRRSGRRRCSPELQLRRVPSPEAAPGRGLVTPNPPGGAERSIGSVVAPARLAN